MLVRIWETRFDLARKAELVAYANEVSLPVLRSRPGCSEVLFLALGDCWITQTIWDDRSSIDALDRDAEYTRIVEGIIALGILGSDQTTRVYEAVGGNPRTDLRTDGGLADAMTDNTTIKESQ